MLGPCTFNTTVLFAQNGGGIEEPAGDTDSGGRDKQM